MKTQPEFSFSNITLFFMAAGLLWGLIMDMGMFTLATVIGGFWLGNGITGLREGGLFSYISAHRPWTEVEYTDRKAEPFFYWLHIFTHFFMAGAIAIYCLRKFH